MDITKLREHIQKYKQHYKRDRSAYSADTAERQERRDYYRSWTMDRILKMSQEDFEEYISKLWAMLIWGNKKYVTDKLITDHGFETVKTELAELVWGSDSVDKRWDRFRSNIKGMKQWKQWGQVFHCAQRKQWGQVFHWETMGSGLSLCTKETMGSGLSLCTKNNKDILPDER